MGRVDFPSREHTRRAVLNLNLTQQGAAMDPATDEFNERFEGAVRTAEVMSIFFPRIGQSLILDMRHVGNDGPLVLLDVMVASPNDRLLSFRRLRPELPLPERLILAPWPGAISSFDESGILAAIVDRCQLEGGEVLVDQIQELYRELLLLERRLLRNMLRGIDTETIWKRKTDG
jgi:hypothetical protein